MTSGSGGLPSRARAAVVYGSLLVLALGACDSGSGGRRAAPRSTTSTTAPRPAVDGTLNLGQLAPVSGPVSAIAASFTTPVRLAVDEMNATGGVDGKAVGLTVADDASTVATARAALTTLVAQQHVDAVIGPSSSEVAAALMPDLPRDHVVMCSGSNSAGALSSIPSGGYYFRTAPPDRLQAVALARLVAGAKHTRPAVLVPKDAYGASFGTELVAAMRRLHLKPTEVSVPQQPDAAAVVTRALQSSPDAVVLVGFPDGVAPLLKALVDAGKAPSQFPVYGSDGLQTADLGALVDPANPAVVVGLTGTTPAGSPAGIDHPLTARMFAAGVDEFFSASAYDCTILIGLAAVAARSDDADAIRTHLAPLLRGRVDCRSYLECSQLLRAGRTIHYRGAFSSYDDWRGTEPGSGVYDVWTMGLDAHPALAPPAAQVAVP
jgi:branched-chain amino acid transport system substrate-binding protein